MEVRANVAGDDGLIYYYVYLTLIVAFVLFCYFRLRIKVYQIVFITLYGLYLVFLRYFKAILGWWYTKPYPEFSVPKWVRPATISEYSTSFNLKPCEVVLGYEGKRPIKIDITDHHTLIGATSGGGKALPLDALVLTPFGFKQMRDIHTNTQITNPDGTVGRVIYESYQGIKRVYRFTLQDGAVVESSEDHLWTYRLAQGQWNRKWKVGTTLQLKSLLEQGKHVLLPMTNPVPYTIKYKQPIDPYLLGVLLGDGCITGTSPLSITSADKELIEHLNQTSGYTWYRSTGKYCWLVKEKKKLKSELEKLGLWGSRSNTKHIPPNYLYGSIENRYELLRGLLDTDGTATSDGKTSYSTASETMARDVQTLVRSLGGKATIRQKKAFYKKNGQRVYCRDTYKIYIRIDHNIPIFRLSRKQQRVFAYNGGVSEIGNRIKTVEDIGQKECKCIAVDNPNGLFITNDFVVTHNSNEIHSILLQLYSHPGFNGWVYLLDMKSHPADRFDLWKPLVKRYEKRDYDGGVAAALKVLQEIEGLLREEVSQPLIVIIDEVYPLTQNKEGDRLLGIIASQIRLNGSLILTVQHPHHQVLKTFTKHNIERRMCGVVVNDKQAEIILESKPNVPLPVLPGQFLLREPGRRGLVQLVADEVDFDEIEQTIGTILERRVRDDWRIALYRDVTENKKIGEKVIGVRQIKEQYGRDAQEKVMVAFRNFANAGLFHAPERRGKSYTVRVPWPEGLGQLNNYFENWEENPDSLILEE